MDNPRSSSFLNPDEILVQEVSGSKIIGRDHIGKSANKQGQNVPRINLDGIKESPMVIDNSQMSPEANQFEYEYHSADKGAGAAIETSM